MDATDPIADAVTAVDGRIAARLAELTALDPELAKLRAARDALAGLCGLAVPAPAPTPVAVPVLETPPGKPTPRAVESRSKPGPKPNDDRPLQIARVLANGPVGSREIGERIGAIAETVLYTLRRHPWFVKTNPDNPRSAYTLSPAGRSALDAAPASSIAPA
jgi:hypothetical protein